MRIYERARSQMRAAIFFSIAFTLRRALRLSISQDAAGRAQLMASISEKNYFRRALISRALHYYAADDTLSCAAFQRHAMPVSRCSAIYTMPQDGHDQPAGRCTPPISMHATRNSFRRHDESLPAHAIYAVIRTLRIHEKACCDFAIGSVAIISQGYATSPVFGRKTMTLLRDDDTLTMRGGRDDGH